MNKNDILKQYFGHSEFRQGQAELIDNILAQSDVLGIMPTGAGKSLCYQVPAMLLEGITIVISPLISLMKDQVNALTQSGVNSAFINSSLSLNQYNQVLKNACDGKYKIIYVAPERLLTDDMFNLSKRINISMITVDEAHCVSQWGQDFRPSYLKIVEFIEKLTYQPIISAFTATATTEVREDIITILRLENPYVITTDFDRKNLYFEIERPKHKFSSLIDFLRENGDKSGIIYCSTRKNVEEICGQLIENGYASTRYHAGLSDKERHLNQDDFLYDRKAIMVATNAFGMGIDKSNVSFVVHYNMPKNLESYYQEVGRAGRDGEPANCLLLYNPQDVRTNQFLIENNQEFNSDLPLQMRQALKEKDKELLKQMTFYSTTTDCLRGYILRYFGESPPHYCGNCSNCNTLFETLDISIEAQKIISCVYRIKQKNRSFGKTIIIDVLRGSKNQKIISFGLDKLSTYGIMADVSVHRLHNIIDFLVESGYLAITNKEYPVLTLTNSAAQIIKDKKTLLMKLPKEVKVQKQKKYSQKNSVVNNKLFTELKALRNEFASLAHVPAYIVFTDATLHDMCGKLPLNNDDFLKVSGVGKTKMEKYGSAFTQLIKTHISANGDNSADYIADNNTVIKVTDRPQHSHQPWPQSEDIRLKEEKEAGLTITQISKLHDRTKGAIRSRLKKMEIYE